MFQTYAQYVEAVERLQVLQYKKQYFRLRILLAEKAYHADSANSDVSAIIHFHGEFSEAEDEAIELSTLVESYAA